MTATMMLDADKNIIVTSPGLSKMCLGMALDADAHVFVTVACPGCNECTIERVIVGERFEIGHAPGCKLEARIKEIVAAHPELTVGRDYCPLIPFPKNPRPS